MSGKALPLGAHHPPSRWWGPLGWSLNACRHPVATAACGATPGQEPEPAAGLCSHWVLQFQGSHFPGEPQPGNALGTSGRGGSLFKSPAGPSGMGAR